MGQNKPRSRLQSGIALKSNVRLAGKRRFVAHSRTSWGQDRGEIVRDCVGDAELSNSCKLEENRAELISRE